MKQVVSQAMIVLCSSLVVVGCSVSVSTPPPATCTFETPNCTEGQSCQVGADGLALCAPDSSPDSGQPRRTSDAQVGDARLDLGVDHSFDCNDGERNGSETDVDCGGICRPCTLNQGCRDDSDCNTRVCNDDICAADGCEDGRKNGDESDLDCGGGCTPCAPSGACARNLDCSSMVCQADRCQPPRCDDGIQNGDESNTDCGGSCPVCLNCETSQECPTGYHCANDVCSIKRDDGQTCETSEYCKSGYCDHGFCCESGRCCDGAASCASVFDGPAFCESPSECRGYHTSTVCENSQCQPSKVPDDSACLSSTVADDCGPYPDLMCTGATDQSIPICHFECSDDLDCANGFRCENEQCVERGIAVNGTSCVDNSDCESGHCSNGYCCQQGECCTTAADCQAYPGSASICQDRQRCQGSRLDVECRDSQCITTTIADDRGCSADVVADQCGFYPSVHCNGEIEQRMPACAERCISNAQCDQFAGCLGFECTNIILNPDGGSCENDDECMSGHCANDVCCAEGDCCNVPDDCPTQYHGPSSCVDSSRCQGQRIDALCVNFQCDHAIIDDDSGCREQVASTCGFFPLVRCTNAVTQDAPNCETTCSSDGECDTNAQCLNGTCQMLSVDGSPCETNEQCRSQYCSNGFCCSAGDCCNVPEDCPVQYHQGATCHEPLGCQGSRVDALCRFNQCVSVAIDDDSACDASIRSKFCRPYRPVFCSGEEIQMNTDCLTSCNEDLDCAPLYSCLGGECINPDACMRDQPCN